MMRSRRGPRQTAKLVEQLQAMVAALSATVTTADLQRIVNVLRERGFKPLPDSPEGTRWKTAAEYLTEFNDPLTTNARRQEIMAIRLMLRPPDTVAL